jgi:Multicopper oxidase
MGNPTNGAQIVDQFPTETEGLPEATRPGVVELGDGDEFSLGITPVAKRLGDTTVRMLAYNGSIPGPTLKVAEGSTVTIHVTKRSRRAQPGLERHRARADRRDCRDPLERHEPRDLDGALPHRRAPRERDDVQLQR